MKKGLDLGEIGKVADIKDMTVLPGLVLPKAKEDLVSHLIVIFLKQL